MKSLISSRDRYKLSNIIRMLGNSFSKGSLKGSKISIKDISEIIVTNKSLK